MKKILSLIIIAFIAFSAVSCSNKSENSATTSETTAQKPTEKKLKKLSGIDVSSYSGEIDWKKVKKSGIDFAMIRIGGRGYGESGVIYTDKTALYNLREAQKYKIKTGVYFFSQAVSGAEAKEEAKFVIKTLGGMKLDLPVAYDVERIKGDSSRIDNIKYSDSEKYAKVFMKTIEKLGYRSMAYIGEDSILKLKSFKDSTIWYADYSYIDNGENRFYMVQTSKNGKIDGINTSVDLDIMYE